MNKNKIDNLISRQCKIIVKKQILMDKSKSKLSAMENKIDRIQNTAFTLKQTTDYKLKALDREIDKIAGLIELERIYTSSGEPPIDTVTDIKKAINK